MVEINWLAVAVGTVGYMVLGALWYGPLFGSTWMRSMGYDGRRTSREKSRGRTTP